MRRLKPVLLISGLLLGVVSVLGLPQYLRPRTAASDLTVEFLDVGQGDAILIRSPDGKAALIDAGPSEAVVSLLRSRGVRSIDMVAVSHHHADHYGGMEAVIRAYRPRLFLATNSSYTTPHYLRLLRLVRASRIPAIAPTDAIRKIDLGSAALTLFPQPPENPHDENDNSIGLRVQYGAFSVLLTGDSEAGERTYWERTVPHLIQDCTVLKLAHHGSRNGTDDRWLGLVRPQLAVASLGKDNEFGHPHRETLALLARRRIPLLRTDRDGTIEVISDGRTWGVAGSPQIGRGPPPRTEPAGRATSKHNPHPTSPGKLVDINSASLEELETLPGIGPTIARRIIEGRPYRTVDDLLRVREIGKARLAGVRPFVTAR